MKNLKEKSEKEKEILLKIKNLMEPHSDGQNYLVNKNDFKELSDYFKELHINRMTEEMTTEIINQKNCKCQLCGSHLNYRYTAMHKGMVKHLFDMLNILELSKKNNTKLMPINYTNTTSITNNLGQLLHWGLAYKQRDKDYYITQKGIDFLQGKISVRDRIYFSNGVPIEESKLPLKFRQKIKTIKIYDVKKLGELADKYPNIKKFFAEKL
jgi:predicted transcriptional regulator